MSEKLWPKEKKGPSPEYLSRPWRVEYDLAYDGGGSSWTAYYRTRWGAKFSAWWNVHVSSWGGSAVLFDNKKEPER